MYRAWDRACSTLMEAKNFDIPGDNRNAHVPRSEDFRAKYNARIESNAKHLLPIVH